mmetsp:Transcript_1964/g.3578  ORF Transcript_1964/g.3578 Transcript_1964/m.3578 type:complete len:89 (+) Transcript_1964:1710-1976(+)
MRIINHFLQHGKEVSASNEIGFHERTHSNVNVKPSWGESVIPEPFLEIGVKIISPIAPDSLVYNQTAAIPTTVRHSMTFPFSSVDGSI